MARDRVLEVVVNNLRSQHYNFANDWIDGCVEFFRSENPNPSTAELQRFVQDQWLLADLREMETACLPPNLLNERKIMLPGKYALQVEAMLDISVSCYSQYQKLRNLTLNEGEEHPNGQFKEPKANRMWQLTLCDGTQVVRALEHETITSLGQPLIPGTKVLIMGPVMCRKGQLMLTARNFKLLGGEIDSMIVPNAYENILCQKLGLPLNPDPYNENPALPDANVAVVLPNVQPAPCNNNLPPLLSSGPQNDHWDEHTQSFLDLDPPDPQPSFSDEDDLIDAAVDAQLLALEQQHIPANREVPLQDELEQQFHDNSDIINLSEDEDILQSFDFEEIERRAMGQPNSVQTTHQNAVNRRTSSNEMRPSMNANNQSLQSPPRTCLPSNQTFQNQPTVRQSSNQPFQNQPPIQQSITQSLQYHSTVRQSNNQTFQNRPPILQSNQQSLQNHFTDRQSSNQTFQNQPTVHQYNKQGLQNQPIARQFSNQTSQDQPTVGQSTSKTLQNQPTVRQSTSKTLQNQPTVRQSTSKTLENQSKVRQPIPSSQSKTNKPKSPVATKQTKLTSFLKPVERLSQSPRSSPTLDGRSGRETFPPRQPSLPDSPPANPQQQLLRGAMVCGPEEEDEDFTMEVDGSPPPPPRPSTRTVDGRPFVYLSQVATAAGTVCTVKAFVMTVVTKITIRKEGWHLVVKICDGSAMLDVVFSSDVVESLIGFSHQEFKAMRSEMSKNPNWKERLVKAFDKAQHALINLNCLMEVEFHGDASLPCVVSLIDVTETHFAALRKRLDSVK